ncbi:aldose 1-epimerase [Kushneria sinocarnis]|uniref:Aldose 1-epimerase n=1 Tax=Kushneria sinocarnis TaxID=595502 RepID=A0A420WW35_9GAMM|nr:aldose epimerase [Kushneria sinocarnis]RKR03349.1 aldose 1-epimerase [Kushneria sinocarnis]
MTFTMHRTTWQQWPVVEVHDEQGVRLRLAERGATLLELVLVSPDGQRLPVIDGARSADELAEGRGARSAIMAPFSNRIDQGRYRFDDHEHQLPTVAGEGHAMHGVVRGMDWEVTEQHADEHAARITLTTRIGETTLPGYPFALRLNCTFTLDEDGLEWSLVTENIGDRPAPFGCGWHPYFVPPGGGVDDVRVVLPATRQVVTDERLIPLAGDAAQQGLGSTTLTLAGQTLDRCFTELARDEDGFCRTRLEVPRSGLALVLAQPYGAVHVFTGDTLGDRPREAVALEPTEFMPDAFNRPELAEQRVIRSGHHRAFGARVSLAALEASLHLGG